MRVGQGLGLLADRINDGRVAVPEAGNRRAAATIKKAFAVCVDHIDAVAAHGFRRVLQEASMDRITQYNGSSAQGSPTSTH